MGVDCLGRITGGHMGPPLHRVQLCHRLLLFSYNRLETTHLFSITTFYRKCFRGEACLALCFRVVWGTGIIREFALSEMTLGMIKPDATGAGKSGKIIAHIEGAGFRIAALKMVRLTKAAAQEFYAEHEGKPFYDPLVEFITSGPVVAMALEADNAVKKFREVIGATDPAEAAGGTVRKLFAESKSRNAVHGSDSPRSAERELKFFFSRMEILQSID